MGSGLNAKTEQIGWGGFGGGAAILFLILILLVIGFGFFGGFI